MLNQSLVDRLKAQELDEKSISTNPFEQFHQWYEDVMQAGIEQLDAMALATAGLDSIPSSRMVLLKHYDQDGFVFYTNYNSRKAQELMKNPFASLTFHWKEVRRQVTIEGSVVKVDDATSDAYFATRPRGSQISAWASSQGEVVEGREELERKVAEFERKYEGQTIPRPSHWGGFVLSSSRFEFLQEREHRLHDRIEYKLTQDGVWAIQRLAP